MLERGTKARQGASVSKTGFGPFNKLKTALKARLQCRSLNQDMRILRVDIAVISILIPVKARIQNSVAGEFYFAVNGLWIPAFAEMTETKLSHFPEIQFDATP